mmetsp:Transcript_41091/g.65004  ORF Transcript_41091/g.65004 Transcript_41091/m.65004 type:complete len:214 (+) Transcript_41091:353-994(+)
MSKSFPVGLIAAVILKFLVIFSAMIVRKLQHGSVSWKFSGSLGHGAQKVEGELGVRVVFVAQEGHSKVFGVKLQGFLGILDPKHGLSQGVSTLLSTSDDLHPVAIRIQCKGQTLHAAFIGLLLKLHPRCVQLVTGLVHVMNGEGHMAEAVPPVSFLWLIPWMVLWPFLLLGAIVMRQLQSCSREVPEVSMGFHASRLRCLFFFRNRGQKVQGK